MESISKPIYFNALKRESDPFLTLSATSYGKNFFLSARSARSARFAATRVFYHTFHGLSTVSGSVLRCFRKLSAQNEKQGEK